MKCKELIELLQQHDEDEEITIVVDYRCGIPQRIVTIEEYFGVPLAENVPCEFRHVLLCSSQRKPHDEKNESLNESVLQIDKMLKEQEKAAAEAYFREQERKPMRPNLSRRERP